MNESNLTLNFLRLSLLSMGLGTSILMLLVYGESLMLKAEAY